MFLNQISTSDSCLFSRFDSDSIIKKSQKHTQTCRSFHLKGIRFVAVSVRGTFGQFAFVSDAVEHIAPKMDTELHVKMI